MPTYEFECKKCDAHHGIKCKMSEYDELIKAGVKCEGCNEMMERVITIGAATILPADFTYNGKKKIF